MPTTTSPTTTSPTTTSATTTAIANEPSRHRGTDSIRVPQQLLEHLRTSLGSWPPRPNVVQVTTSIERERPAWDGAIVAAQRLDTPAGSVLSVPARLLPDAPQHASIAEADRWLRAALPTERWQTVEYRWCSTEDPVADLDDAGTWAAPDDPVEEWLRPFNGGVLVATIHGVHAAAVGIKRHDHHAHEIAVVTSAAHRGHGLARRLVAQATRAIHAQGAIALYLHAPDNDASRHVADHVGFHDAGWRLTTSAT